MPSPSYENLLYEVRERAAWITVDRPDIPADLAAIVEKMMADSADKRFQSAGQVIKKCALALAIGLSRSSCQATASTLTMRRPWRVIRPQAKVSMGRPGLR